MARARKTDQEQSAGKKTKKTAPEQETPEQTTDHAQEQEAPEQTTDPAPEPEDPEQDQDHAPEPETAEQTTDPAKEQEAPEQDQGAAPKQETPEQTLVPTPEPDMFAKLPNPCVYCGPSVKGIARQYTTYQGGIPDVLREFIKARPEALGLIVSTGQFRAMRRRLETPGTKEAKLYKAVKART